MAAGAVAALCLVQFVDVLGVTSALTALPVMLEGVGAGPAAAGPVATVYSMFFGGLLVLGARLGDRYGHRRVLLVGLIGFALVSLLGASATGLPLLLVARALQGAAAALSAPSALRLLLHLSPDGPRRARTLAAWSAVGAAAGAMGFLVGGVLSQLLGWRAVFWINAPVGALLIIAVLLAVKAQPEGRDRAKLDIVGAGLLIVAVMALIAGAPLLERPDGRAVGAGLMVLGLALGAGFVQRMRTARAPLLPPAALGSRNLRRGTVQAFVNTATTSSAAVLATVYLQDVLHLSSLQAGLTLTTFSIAVIVGSTVAGRIEHPLGLDRLAAVGLLAIGVGNGTLVLTTGTYWGVPAGMALSGFGIGLASVGATALGTSVPPDLSGSATGVINTGAQLGTALGTSSIVLIAALSSTAVGWATAAVGALATALWCLRRARPGSATINNPASSL